MNSLKELQKKFGGSIQQQDLLHPTFSRHSLRRLVFKTDDGLKLSVHDFEEYISAEVKIESDFAFSINKPDRILFFNQQVSSAVIAYPIYVSSSNLEIAKSAGFKSYCGAFQELLSKHPLSADEQMFLARNGIDIKARSDRDLPCFLNDVVQLVHENKSLFKIKINAASHRFLELPEALVPLIPILKKFAVSDDQERSDLIDKMSTLQQKRLLAFVDPYFPAINDYLGSFQTKPLTETVASLGNLAELVSELKLKHS